MCKEQLSDSIWTSSEWYLLVTRAVTRGKLLDDESLQVIAVGVRPSLWILLIWFLMFAFCVECLDDMNIDCFDREPEEQSVDWAETETFKEAVTPRIQPSWLIDQEPEEEKYWDKKMIYFLTCHLTPARRDEQPWRGPGAGACPGCWPGHASRPGLPLLWFPQGTTCHRQRTFPPYEILILTGRIFPFVDRISRKWNIVSSTYLIFYNMNQEKAPCYAKPHTSLRSPHSQV